MPAQPRDHQAATFTATLDGKSYTLTRPTPKLLRSVRRRDPLDLMFTLFEECGDEKFLAALDARDDMDEVNEVFSEWMATLGGGDAGKSGGSSS